MDYKMLTEKLMHALLQKDADALQVSYCSKGVEYGYYHTLHLGELITILQQLNTKTILDLGCGTGLLLAQLRCELPYLTVKGVDNEPALLAIAGQLIEAEYKNILELTAADLQGFDTLYTWCPFTTPATCLQFLNLLVLLLEPHQYLICSTEGCTPIAVLLDDCKELTPLGVFSDNFKVFKKKPYLNCSS